MNRNVLSRRVLAGVALATLALAGCSEKSNDTPGSGSSSGATGGSEYANLSGALKASGATFPDAYYQEVVSAFKEAAPNVTVTYNAVGSGTGKKEFGEGLTDFAGSDSLVKEGQGPKEGEFLYVPTVAAPITVSYNLNGVSELKLSPDTLAGIFGRTIKTWDDAAIKADNPGATLPSKPITVVHRSDGSGTTSNFTKYLESASTKWTLGSGDTVDWPKDTQGGEKNSGVSQLIKQSDGAIGYVDLSDAKASQLVFASIKNKDGQFVAPTLEGAQAALDGAKINDDLSYDPLNASGATAYPITSPTYLLVKTKYDDPAKAALVKGFLKFLLSSEGQGLAKDVDFAALPQSLHDKALAQIEKF
ncbi:phosphate ABC transporter substrate-binding protein PstS [Rhizomonospora bruguierae]|uniref:phosphate ABC transporter substrate-binding protein PstS n=1 Tax=Rhizomonospora bruguierae TaxID=1581705 RepID=UPI001BCD186E|nr:phosphate ABC transporter substrate-binding protein PstS [Micromonospora sp. NBRC 107566]